MLWELWYFKMFILSSRITAIPPHSLVIYRIQCHWGCNGPFNLHILSTVQTQQTWVGTDVEKVEENILTCDKQWLDNVWTFSAAFQFWRRLGFAGLHVCLSLFLFWTSGSDSMKNFSFLYNKINQLTFFWVPYFKLLLFLSKRNVICASWNFDVHFIPVILMCITVPCKIIWCFSQSSTDHHLTLGIFPKGFSLLLRRIHLTISNCMSLNNTLFLLVHILTSKRTLRLNLSHGLFCPLILLCCNHTYFSLNNHQCTESDCVNDLLLLT